MANGIQSNKKYSLNILYRVIIMKTIVKSGVLIFVLSFSSICFGQQVHEKSFQENTLARWNLPTDFRAGLQINLFTHPLGRHDKTTAGFTYRIDTALVYSNGVNPQRYVYAYDTTGNKVSSLLERLINEKWEYISKDTAQYDSVGNRLVLLTKVWMDNAWVNSSESVCNYTINHHMVYKLNKTWADNQWTPVDSVHYSYNENGSMVASYRALWTDSVSTWKNKSFRLYSYDTSGNLKLSLLERWADSVWLDNQLIQYTYDSASNLISGLFQNRGDTSWVNFYRENYTYDSVRNRTAYTGQFWKDTTWKNDQHYSYTYNSIGKVVLAVGENWADTAWVNFEKGEYTYDIFGGIETYLYRQWKNDSVWENVSLLQYNYDTAGNAYFGNYYTWDTTGNWSQDEDGVLQIYYNYNSATAYFTGYQVKIKYNSPLTTGVVENREIISQYECIPNPAESNTSVMLHLKNSGNVSIVLYSLTGKKLATVHQGFLKKGGYRFPLSVSRMPSGFYFVSLVSHRELKTIKLIVKK